MIHEEKRKTFDEISQNDFKTPYEDKNRTILNENCGQRLQNDKLVEIQYEMNQVITQNKLQASKDPVFAGTYSAVVQNRIKGVLKELKNNEGEESEESYWLCCPLR